MQHIPNALSVSRVPFTFAVAAVLFTEHARKACFAFCLLVCASITDYLDGWAARKYRVVSTFGIMFDSLADKILTIGVFAAFLALGFYPRWFVFGFLVIISREFAVSGLRIAAARSSFIMAAEKGGKIKCAVEMVAACCTLAGEALSELGAQPTMFSAIKIAGEVLFLLSSVLAVQSGWSYFHKYGYLLYDVNAKNE